MDRVITGTTRNIIIASKPRDRIITSKAGNDITPRGTFEIRIISRCARNLTDSTQHNRLICKDEFFDAAYFVDAVDTRFVKYDRRATCLSENSIVGFDTTIDRCIGPISTQQHIVTSATDQLVIPGLALEAVIPSHTPQGIIGSIAGEGIGAVSTDRVLDCCVAVDNHRQISDRTHCAWRQIDIDGAGHCREI